MYGATRKGYNVINFLKNMSVLGVIGVGTALIPLAHIGGGYNPFNEEQRKNKLQEVNDTMRRVHLNGTGVINPWHEVFPDANLHDDRVFVPAKTYWEALQNWKELMGFDMNRWGYRKAQKGAQRVPSIYDGLTPDEMADAFLAKFPNGEGASEDDRAEVRRAIHDYRVTGLRPLPRHH